MIVLCAVTVTNKPAPSPLRPAPVTTKYKVTMCHFEVSNQVIPSIKAYQWMADARCDPVLGTESCRLTDLNRRLCIPQIHASFTHPNLVSPLNKALTPPSPNLQDYRSWCLEEISKIRPKWGKILKLVFAAVGLSIISIPVGQILSFLAVLDRIACGRCGTGCFGKCCRGLGAWFGVVLMLVITTICAMLLIETTLCLNVSTLCLSGDESRDFGITYGLTVLTSVVVTQPLVLFLKVLIFRMCFRSDNGSCKYKIVRACYGRDHMVATFAVFYKDLGRALQLI